MRAQLLISSGLALLVLGAPATAGIPEPDAILYGTMAIDGQPVTADDDVTVIARVRVGNVEHEVGRYAMGDNAAAGDNYVLRVRLESLADESEPSTTAARVGDTALIYVQESDAEPVLLARVGLTERGMVRSLNLPALAGDFDQDGDLDLSDYIEFQRCFSGPGQPVGPGCAAADLDGDGDADLADLVVFQSFFTGAR